ncbi:calcium-binding protein P-like [Ostrea edulis]|uniref:calcium-binding protein P-like n=1 Tax=Ostrea edulis TaxID=37623 RepID=UPI0024AFE2E9|nr:calcium-binding protein P-like [Ostrea edulis]
MSAEKSQPPPDYNQVTNPGAQPQFAYGNQYNQYPGQYPEGQSQYPGGQSQHPGGQYAGGYYPQQGGVQNQYPSHQYYPVGGTPGQYPQGGGAPPGNVVVTQPGPATMVISQPPQQDWMVPAILSCLCCFWPTGIFAILAANRAKNAAAVGNAVEAQEQSRRARTLVITSVVIGIIVIGLSIVLRVIVYSSYNSYY